MTAAHCEAKLHGFRKTQDGIVVSFVLHPQDWPQQLALDPLGTRYMLAVAQIGDDEQQVSAATPLVAATKPGCMDISSSSAVAVSPAVVPERAENRDASTECSECHKYAGHCPYCHRERPSVAEVRKQQQDAKARYAAMDDQEKAAVRAVLLCRDVRFQDWLYALSPSYRRQRLSDAPPEECAALWMHGECGIASRREIATDYDAYGRFVALENRYRLATGQMAEERG